MSQITTDDTAILILSCDKYFDLQELAVLLLRRFWVDCPFKVYVGGNTLVFDKDASVQCVLSGRDEDWSSSLRKILEQIEEKYVFLFLEDYVLTSAPSTSEILYFLNTVKTQDINNAHYYPAPLPDHVNEDGKFGVYSPGAPYRATVESLWERDYLLKLLLDGESPWDFEIMGSYRCSYSGRHWCSMAPLFTLVNLVEKGHWTQEGVEADRKMGLGLNMEKRKVLQKSTLIKSICERLFFNLIKKIPWSYRVKMMAMLRKLLISY
ncbi:MAG: hypothetical protein RQ899_01750 [Pseudomonadales bacterium]|nr:hypothetical protein [Pseudomonadales bacterium]